MVHEGCYTVSVRRSEVTTGLCNLSYKLEGSEGDHRPAEVAGLEANGKQATRFYK